MVHRKPHIDGSREIMAGETAARVNGSRANMRVRVKHQGKPGGSRVNQGTHVDGSRGRCARVNMLM